MVLPVRQDKHLTDSNAHSNEGYCLTLSKPQSSHCSSSFIGIKMCKAAECQKCCIRMEVLRQHGIAQGLEHKKVKRVMSEAELKWWITDMEKKLFKLLWGSHPSVEDIPREDTVNRRMQVLNEEFMRFIIYLSADLVSSVFKNSLKAINRL